MKQEYHTTFFMEISDCIESLTIEDAAIAVAKKYQKLGLIGGHTVTVWIKNQQYVVRRGLNNEFSHATLKNPKEWYPEIFPVYNI